jgi:hypothetical protein
MLLHLLLCVLHLRKLSSLIKCFTTLLQHFDNLLSTLPFPFQILDLVNIVFLTLRIIHNVPIVLIDLYVLHDLSFTRLLNGISSLFLQSGGVICKEYEIFDHLAHVSDLV